MLLVVQAACDECVKEDYAQSIVLRRFPVEGSISTARAFVGSFRTRNLRMSRLSMTIHLLGISILPLFKVFIHGTIVPEVLKQ